MDFADRLCARLGEDRTRWYLPVRRLPVLEAAALKFETMERAATLGIGSSEALSVCARRLLAQTDAARRDPQWDAIVDTNVGSKKFVSRAMACISAASR